ncbi:Predicted dehydrogenase [Devosia crocina]|uniref:Predicted dehydrogenase n=1 Tax=Devosia crocina TaxID=429728 RepID=A0A1I7N190_9HYPH|nr:Gfo/Idh/MocA family oxidoreductase [Devosia crocina]SFV28420.1 Predicted dehydrogenase [Devosia crocina]
MIVGDRVGGRSLRWGMVGGGRGSQIGYVHRSAATRDGIFALVAGALDVDGERGRAFGIALGMDPSRSYPDYKVMFTAEAGREDGIEVVSIATPNNTHFVICKAALEHDLHVICEKPLCFTVAEAEELAGLAKSRQRTVGVAYGYSGYQMIEEARALVAAGELGDIRVVNFQFSHGFHNTAVEQESPSTRWRVTPEFAGPSYVLGDLGTHPFYLSEVILPHLRIKRLLCTRQSFVGSRAPLEDNATVLMEYESGAVATAWISAVNAGAMHSQKIRVVGSRGSLEWWDEHPNQLSLEIQGQPPRLLDRGMPYLHGTALEEDRIGAGHPEGLFDAWANLYRRFALAITGSSQTLTFPGIEAGLEGVRWVENCVRSADQGGVWVDYR